MCVCVYVKNFIQFRGQFHHWSVLLIRNLNKNNFVIKILLNYKYWYKQNIPLCCRLLTAPGHFRLCFLALTLYTTAGVKLHIGYKRVVRRLIYVNQLPGLCLVRRK